MRIERWRLKENGEKERDRDTDKERETTGREAEGKVKLAVSSKNYKA